MNEGRILGLDAGERRIGVAISDPGRSFALPLNSFSVDGKELDQIASLVQIESIEAIVIGLPLSLSGESSAQTERAQAFAAQVEARTGLTVQLWDERLSSRQAEGMIAGLDEDRGGRDRGGRKKRGGRGEQGPDTDALAASIILQAYLDRLGFERGA